MADAFEGHQASITAPASKHAALSADAGNDIDPRPRAVYCQADGTITLTDDNDNALAYAMTAGQVLAFRAKRCTAIASGTFYAWS